MRASLLIYAQSSFPDHSSQEPSMHCIVPSNDSKGGVYLGNLASAKNKFDLQQKGIKAVLTVMSDKEITFDRSIQHLFIRADDADFQQLDKSFEEAIRFINEQRKSSNVLVHCYAGISRSTTLVIAFLMKIYGLGLKNALHKVQSIRNIVNPNPGFMRQLQRFEQTNNKQQEPRRPISSAATSYKKSYPSMSLSEMSYGQQENRQRRIYEQPIYNLPSQSNQSYVRSTNYDNNDIYSKYSNQQMGKYSNNQNDKYSNQQIDKQYNKYIDLQKSVSSIGSNYGYNPASPTGSLMNRQRNIFSSSAYRGKYTY